jgi:hypothetical protein
LVGGDVAKFWELIGRLKPCPQDPLCWYLSKQVVSCLSSPLSRSFETNSPIGYDNNPSSANSGAMPCRRADLRQILQRATELCAQGLEARFAKVLEFLPDEDRLMVRAGVGWGPDTIDVVSLSADLGSPAGYAYQTGEMVISNHLETEPRFRTPWLLKDNGIKRAINVLIERGGEGKAFFGVLEVDSADPGRFDEADA